ncbi:MAG TPA: hypothetical protein VGJ63_14060 [Micromonosporaceae bacterium]
MVAAIRRERGRTLSELAEAGNALSRVADMARLGSRRMAQSPIASYRGRQVGTFEQVVDVSARPDGGH